MALIIAVVVICVVGLTLLIVVPLNSYAMKGDTPQDKAVGVIVLIICIILIMGLGYRKAAEEKALENINQSEVYQGE